MNINADIANAVTTRLETILDTVPPRPHTRMQKEAEYYSFQLCKKLLMDFYECSVPAQKKPEKLLGALFDGMLTIRYVYDAYSDYKTHTITIAKITAEYDMWLEGRQVLHIRNNKDHRDYFFTKALAIQETLALVDELHLELGDNGILKNQMSALVSFALFCFRFDYRFFNQ